MNTEASNSSQVDRYDHIAKAIERALEEHLSQASVATRADGEQVSQETISTLLKTAKNRRGKFIRALMGQVDKSQQTSGETEHGLTLKLEIASVADTTSSGKDKINVKGSTYRSDKTLVGTRTMTIYPEIDVNDKQQRIDRATGSRGPLATADQVTTEVVTSVPSVIPDEINARSRQSQSEHPAPHATQLASSSLKGAGTSAPPQLIPRFWSDRTTAALDMLASAVVTADLRGIDEDIRLEWREAILNAALGIAHDTFTQASRFGFPIDENTRMDLYPDLDRPAKLNENGMIMWVTPTISGQHGSTDLTLKSPLRVISTLPHVIERALEKSVRGILSDQLTAEYVDQLAEHTQGISSFMKYGCNVREDSSSLVDVQAVPYQNSNQGHCLSLTFNGKFGSDWDPGNMAPLRTVTLKTTCPSSTTDTVLLL